MKRDHFFYTLTLALMFLAPRVPTSLLISSAPTKSSISLAIVGLGLWAVWRPNYILRPRMQLGVLHLFLLIYAAYGLTVTMLNFDSSGTPYAAQNLLYAFLAAMLITNYIYYACRYNQFDKVIRRTVAIAVIYAFGVIISYWTGPIYPEQVMEYGRFWAGVYYSQGIGFGVNQNSVGGAMLVFLPVIVLIYSAKGFQRAALSVISIAALLLTISRAAILGCAVGFAAMYLAIAVRPWFGLGSTRKQKRTIVWATCMAAAVAGGLFVLLSMNDELRTSVIEGFGLGSYGLYETETARTHAWNRGISFWKENSIPGIVFGEGFRGSAIVSDQYFGTAHNFFLAALGDFGVIGFLLFFVPYLALLWRSWLIAMRGERRGVFGVWTLFSLFFLNLTETFFYGVEFVFLLTFVAVLIVVPSWNACAGAATVTARAR